MAQGPAQLVDVDGRRLRLTSLDKVMYPETGMTKGEMIAYYAEIARKVRSRTDREYLTEQLASASWLVKALETKAKAHGDAYEAL
jgi:DNA-directed RNA polymerase specialized sigma54-like protein